MVQARAAARDARGGARRPGADQWLTPPSASHALVGLGRRRRIPGCCRRTRSPSCASTVGVAPVPRPPVALERCACPSSALGEGLRAELPRSSAATPCARITATACCTRPARATPTSCGCARDDPRGRPTRSSSPRATSRCARCSALCARALGRGRPVRRRHERRRRRRAAARRAPRGRLRSTWRAWGRALARPRVGDRGRCAAVCARPALERYLRPRGLTLGHFPQSYEYVSLGGCAATRSAGQASTGYGAIERMVTGLRLAAPAARDRRCRAMPATAAGPGLRQLLVGSEGTLGVISELSLRVRPRPATCVYEGVFFEDFAAGVAGPARARARSTRSPTSRGSPTRPRRACRWRSPGSGGLKGRLGRAYLGAARLPRGLPGDRRLRGGRRRGGARRERALRLGARERRPRRRRLARSRLARVALRGRPTCATTCSTLGVMVETLETADARGRTSAPCTARSSGAIDESLAAGGTPGLVMCHVSHVYETGASLYFTFLARQRERTRDRPVARGQARRERGDRGGRRHDHPPPRGRARSRARGWSGDRRRACASCAR